MDNIDESSMHIPKKKNVALLILLTIITLGIYTYFWYLNRADELNNLQTKTKTKRGLIVTAFILYILAVLMIIGMEITALVTKQNINTNVISDIPLPFQILFIAAGIIILVHCIVLIIIAFNVRKILNEAEENKQMSKRTSVLFTMFMNFFYLQYEINRIINDKENKHKIGPWILFILLYIVPIILGAIEIFYPGFYLKYWIF